MRSGNGNTFLLFFWLSFHPHRWTWTHLTNPWHFFGTLISFFQQNMLESGALQPIPFWVFEWNVRSYPPNTIWLDRVYFSVLPNIVGLENFLCWPRMVYPTHCNMTSSTYDNMINIVSHVHQYPLIQGHVGTLGCSPWHEVSVSFVRLHVWSL